MQQGSPAPSALERTSHLPAFTPHEAPTSSSPCELQMPAGQRFTAPPHRQPLHCLERMESLPAQPQSGHLWEESGKHWPLHVLNPHSDDDVGASHDECWSVAGLVQWERELGHCCGSCSYLKDTNTNCSYLIRNKTDGWEDNT